MKVLFQKKKIDPYIELKKFSFINKSSGSIQSFIGKMRPMKDGKAISNMEIEFYKKMAYYQTEKNLKNLLKKINIDDFLIIHRYGKILPSENIVLVLVASKHRKEGFIFKEEILNWFKKKITFWKKENFKHHSSWVEAE